MTKTDLARKIYELSYLTGSFLLRSGQISNEYFDKYQFESNPEILSEICNQMIPLIPENTEVLAGLEMGGIPISTTLALKTGMNTIFVRKKAKEYGTCKIAEGAQFDNKRVCIIEDVVTTGGQIIESAIELRNAGAVVSYVLCVIVRDQRAFTNLGDAGLTLVPLFSMQEIKALL